MALDFPTGVTVGYIYTYGGRSWQWNGTAWDVYVTAANAVTLLNGFTGSVTIAGGTAIGISNLSNNITVFYTGSGFSGGIGPTGPQGIQGPTGPTGPVGSYVISINGLSGNVNLAAGSNITITPSGNTLTIASTASGGGGTSYSFFQGATAPTGFSAGDRWFDVDEGKLFTAINDGATAIWVEFAGPPGPKGATGAEGDPLTIVWFLGV